MFLTAKQSLAQKMYFITNYVSVCMSTFEFRVPWKFEVGIGFCGAGVTGG